MNVVEQRPGKLRITTDHSFPRNDLPEETVAELERRKDMSLEERATEAKIPMDPERTSINAVIDTDEFKCDWGTFSDCYLKVAEAPEGTQVAVFDVDSAFRNVPTRPAQRIFLMVLINILIHINLTLDFGASPSPGIFGRIADAMVVIFLFRGIQAVLKWVDDFIFFRYPKGRTKDGEFIYAYDASLIWSIADKVGWPWARKKFVDFASKFTYIGFDWDLVAKDVQLPEKKKEKYRAKLEPFLTKGSMMTRKEIDSLAGTLNHVCLVSVEGRSRMPSLYKMRASFKEDTPPFVKHTVSATLAEDLKWWHETLGKEFVGLKCTVPKPVREDVSIMVDASTSWGIGLVLNGRWLAWKLKEGWKSEGRDIGWGEMVAIELAIRTLKAAGFSGSHIRLLSDNQGVIGGLRAGRSRGKQQNAILRRIVSLMQDYDIWLTIEYVATKENIADAPSRGEFGRKKDLLQYPPKVPRHLKPYLENSIAHSDL